MKQKQHSIEAIIRILRQSEGDEMVESILSVLLDFQPKPTLQENRLCNFICRTFSIWFCPT